MNEDLRERWSLQAHRRVREAGLRTGAARAAVVDRLAADGQCLVSAADIAGRLRADGQASVATVYRVLDELFELGLLHRLDGRDGVARFEIADPDDHHHHFVDEVTGEVRPFADPGVERAIEAVAERLGVRLTGHDLVLRGHAPPATRSASPSAGS